MKKGPAATPGPFVFQVRPLKEVARRAEGKFLTGSVHP